MFNGTSFGFVNCHLTSGNEKTARRNQNYLDILRLLSLGDKQLSSFDISLRFTHLFWFGDLNYRLDMDIQEILNYISRKEFEPLLKVDQLNLEKEKHKVFLRFGEGTWLLGGVLCPVGRGAGVSESSVGEWLRAMGLQRYEEGLLHNGWDDMEFLSDITEEDLEEAGVLDPKHKRALLDSLQLRK
ncbi:UNVERIFIED_CONTAM: hypothetical protein H355_005652 [Colinus virginianus]|nr:hypothetical protein H355_005652 [Colinus virginianus]